uniref:Ground-like domain-containing protein n=1 Tax=Panagrolaimus superbus TaxID=310955 RepID=A0A914XSU4_9BILA
MQALKCLLLILVVVSFVEAFPFIQRLRRQSGATKGSDALDISDARCNSEELLQIMTENISADVKQSRFKIMEAAEAQLGGNFNVVCANGDFSYITSTRLYCLTTLENIKCYAFLAEGKLDRRLLKH